LSLNQSTSGKIGYFAPLPPARTGVAEYAAALLPGLRAQGLQVEINGAAGLPLYQIGNNKLHAEIYDRALRQPGVVILHDALLHHFLLGHLNGPQYIDEYAYNYGEWMREAAGRLWVRRGDASTDPRFFERPLLRRLCQSQRAIIVHNSAAAAAVRAHAPHVPVEIIPHLFAPPREHFYREIDEYRQRVLQAGPERAQHCVFAVMGHLRPTKRLDVVLDAFIALRQRGLPATLVIQGELLDKTYERALATRLAHPGVIRLGYLDEAEWWMLAHAIDVAINLRWPLAGESSGIATRLMGIGRPVLLTRSQETEALPEVSCIKIDPGQPERLQVESFLVWLSENVEARRSIGRHAALHIAQHHNLENVSAQIATLLRSLDCGLTSDPH
jgi:glycosyltransferase involved in cell wall biosynthesis